MSDADQPTPIPDRPPYEAPRLTRLGQWDAVTLVYSLPSGPGARLFRSTTKPNWFEENGL
jgi:hypothetical protein